MNKLLLCSTAFCLALAGLVSCESTTTAPPTASAPVSKPAVFVLNEGAFTHTNSSLDVYEISSAVVTNGIYPHPGDVGHDIHLINGSLYMVMNGSNKILVLRPDSATKVDSISYGASLSGPERMAQVSANEAWVTQINSNYLSIVDLTSHRQTAVVPVRTGTNGIAVLNGIVYVTGGPDSLMIINPLSAKPQPISAVVRVPSYPDGVFADSANNQIIVQAGSSAGDSTYFYFVIPAGTIAATLAFSCANYINDAIVFGPAVAYVLTPGKVMTVDLKGRKVVNSALIAGSFIGGGYDAAANELYLGNGGYAAAGTVEVHDPTTGALKRSFPAGIAPAHFAFYR